MNGVDRDQYITMKGQRFKDNFEGIEKLLGEHMGKLCFIAAGYVLYNCHPRLTEDDKYGDIDIYLKEGDERNFSRVKHHLLNKGCVELRETLGGINFISKTGALLQLIKPNGEYHPGSTYGEASEILQGYDFTICKIAYLGNGRVICHPTWAEDCVNRVLIYENTGNPEVSMHRAMKYHTRGYMIPKETFSALIKDYYNWPWAEHHSAQLFQLKKMLQRKVE